MSPEPVARPHPEPVVLDIGGRVGALIVYAEEELLDTPIEVSPAEADSEKFHQHILERPMPSGTSYAAVFDKIVAGRYTLWLHGEPRVRDFEIIGATVSEVDWREAAGGQPPPLWATPFRRARVTPPRRGSDHQRSLRITHWSPDAR